MNRRNLRQFVTVDSSEESRERKLRRRVNSIPPKEVTSLTYIGTTLNSNGVVDDDEEESLEAEEKVHRTLYLIPEDPSEGRRPLARLPTCAVFHKLTAGRGVPHTFYGFLRQWPALPRVVVSYTKTIRI